MAIALANKTSGNITLPDNSTVTVDWSGAFTPTAGSTIVLVISSLSNSATAVEVTPAAGWSTAAMTNSGALDCWVLYKPNVTTSDTSVVLTVNDIASAQNGVYSVYELTGARTSGSIDAAGTAEDENYVASANTTIQCGTTSTLTYGAGIALAVAAIDSAANWSSGAWSSGWTNEITIDRSTSTGHRVASKSFSATTALSASFGSITSDECYGAIVAIYDATTGTTVTPGVGSLVITGQAPTVSATAHQTVTTGLGALEITGYAPTVDIAASGTKVDTGLGELTLTGLAPTLNITEHQTVATGAGALVVTGYAPTLETTGPITVTTGLGSLEITGHVPTIQTTQPIVVSPEVAALSINGYAPTITVTSSVRGRARRRYYHYIINDKDEEKARRDAEYAARRLRMEIQAGERKARKDNAAMAQEVYRRMVALRQELTLVENYLDERDEADEIAELMNIL
jgi:hypothetical protein